MAEKLNSDGLDGNEHYDDFIYMCKKIRMKANYTRALCRWEGTFSEYITHIQKEHSQSYFHVNNKNEQNFQWKILCQGDQTDAGVLNFGTKHFIYEIYYKESGKTLYFSLKATKSLKCVINYNFSLYGQKEPFSITEKVKKNLSEYKLPIYKQNNVVNVTDSILSKYINNQEFKWNLNICTEL